MKQIKTSKTGPEKTHSIKKMWMTRRNEIEIYRKRFDILSCKLSQNFCRETQDVKIYCHIDWEWHCEYQLKYKSFGNYLNFAPAWPLQKRLSTSMWGYRESWIIDSIVSRAHIISWFCALQSRFQTEKNCKDVIEEADRLIEVHSWFGYSD